MKVDRIHAVHVEDSIDNRRVVRSSDDRMQRDFLLYTAIALLFVVLFASFGVPRAVLRDTGSSVGKLQREHEKLLEQNRELRLEKASLQDLKRVQTIANTSLGLTSPAPADVIVVERPQNLPRDSRTASKAAQNGTPQ